MKNVTAMLAPLLQDPAFKAKLIADPKAALAERGLKVPEGLTIEVHEAAGGWGAVPDNPSDPLGDCYVGPLL
ncbi:MAG: Nitrile hydratase, alpha chain [Planctomycetota bacterium]